MAGEGYGRANAAGPDGASAKLTGLLTQSQQSAISAAILAQQRPDGGFSMASLVGSWKRKDGTPLEAASDGYATGLIAFALEQVNAPESQHELKRAIAWLRTNQREDGRWAAASLNKQRELSSEAGLFILETAVSR